jgi:putative ABC transport system substrate-binding protein
MRRIGVFIAPTEENDPESQVRITAFRQGLEALGWTEGRNIRIDYRFGGGDVARIQAYAAGLVKAAPDVIVANSSAVVVALKHATRTIPIVVASFNDPVAQGFVASLARPGGNITGFTYVVLLSPYPTPCRDARLHSDWVRTVSYRGSSIGN